MLARVLTAALAGLSARPITVEVDLARGLPAFHLVGLPDGTVRESRERVLAALANSGFDAPLRRITVNLAPADEPKSGSGLDLPIALAILCASGAVQPPVGDAPPLAAIGELSLDGRVCSVRGVLPAAAALKAAGAREFLVPSGNAGEAALVDGLRSVPVRSLRAAVDHLTGLVPVRPAAVPARRPAGREGGGGWSEVRGQAGPRRALEIAAAGGHNVLLIGPPGAGKTFLARRFPAILPPLLPGQALEVTAIHSAWGRLTPARPLIHVAPFRAPHHTISAAGLLGGGHPPRPGEVTLAHRGVLFLDELTEFRRDALEGLRQPIEEGELVIGRAQGRHRYPARFIFLGATNPCPCGYWGEPLRPCLCQPAARERYRGRLSGPLVDRIDLHVRVRPVPFAELVTTDRGESAAAVRARVGAARRLQRSRSATELLNARLDGNGTHRWCALSPECRRLLESAHERLGLSARAHVRVLRVARTIADLEGAREIAPVHLAEAIQYRLLDRAVREGQEALI
ncbi:MAG TPA: YifB family Mg chelatase-like AAA ATPase [Gemmatimonadota bacterium]|nr:YifB family Mg chelatase-like AAA ATPase [Gemmatimonadota bacterium]